ncbi:MAG: hypothetical protein GX876_08790, partial [Bacteroidales bacterium]|nr:hypothetical protein [Bacteroidales bacterium]
MSDVFKIIIITSLALAVISCTESGMDKDPSFAKEVEISYAPADTAVSKAPVLLFGIPTGSFNVITGKIRRNGFLSQILTEYGIAVREIEELVRNSSDIFDVRKIRAGNNYFILCDNDSAGRAKYLIYEHDPALSYIFSFNDSLNITPFRKEITRKIKYSSGTVETSLWEAMVSEGLNPL